MQFQLIIIELDAIQQAMESEQIQAALQKALEQTVAQEQEDPDVDIENFRSMLANMHEDGDDTKAQLMRFMAASMQGSDEKARAQWRWWRRNKIWSKAKKALRWIG